MTTNSNIDRRAKTTGMPAAAHSSAPYVGAAGWRVACQGTSSLNSDSGGQLIERHSFRPEGVKRADGGQLQN